MEFSGKLPSTGEVMEVIGRKLSDDIDAGIGIAAEPDDTGVRCIRIGPYPPVPCGGTHQLNTSTLVGLRLTKAKLRKEN